MKKSSLLFIFLCITSLLIAQQRPAKRTAQVTKPVKSSGGRIIGEIFSDYYYIVNQPQPANPTRGTLGRNEFDIRRAQFGYEHTFNKFFSGRVVYDASANVLQEGYFEWNNIFPMHTFTMGMMQTTAEMTAEKVWGYRSLGELVLNRYGFVQEYDMGVSLMGKFDPRGMSYYTFGITNGTGVWGDNDKIKKYALSVGFLPDKMNTVELYADFENYSLGKSAITAKIFYGITGPKFAFGFEGFYRMNRKFAGTNDVTPAGASLLSWFEMTRAIRGVIRVDGVDNDLKVSNAGYRDIYVNAGIDFTPIASVHVIPNLIYVKELKKGNSPAIVDYIVARLTAAVYFPTLE